MLCPFCKQDVEAPCCNTVEIQRWANDRIERCAKALRSLKGIVYS